MTFSIPSRVARRWLGGAVLGLALGVAGCDSVLDVVDPDIVTDASSAAGALALRNGTILRFIQATSGGGDNPDGIFLFSGLLADEWTSGDTFEQRNTTDQRDVATTNSFVQTLSLRMHRVRTEGRAAINGLRQYSPTPSSNIGQMFALIAFSENQMGEVFCNGIPFSEVSGASINFGAAVPYDSAFRRAVNHADSALNNVGGTDGPRIANLAAVVKGRALLNRNQPAAAAAAVANVPTTFVYTNTHSVNSTDNSMWQQNISIRRYGVANLEGVNGLPFRDANDPRLPTIPGVAITGEAIIQQQIWTARDNPVTIASGIEARLIEAENFLRLGDITNFLARLNAARQTRTGLPNLSDPGTADGRIDLLFRERAFWLFSTGHRLGDLRRLVRQYGRSIGATFPTGTWKTGGTYQTAVNFPIPFAEINNPVFTGSQANTCVDRNP